MSNNDTMVSPVNSRCYVKGYKNVGDLRRVLGVLPEAGSFLEVQIHNGRAGSTGAHVPLDSGGVHRIQRRLRLRCFLDFFDLLDLLRFRRG